MLYDPGQISNSERHQRPRRLDWSRGISFVATSCLVGMGTAQTRMDLDPKGLVRNLPEMIRNILAVVAGYLSMMVAVFILLTAAYFAFGTERAFEPGSYRTSFIWCIASLVLGLPAAVLGGWICSRIAASSWAVSALVFLVVALGALIAVPTFSSQPAATPRPADVPNLEAMTKAQTPSWVALLNIVVGAGGVYLGGRCCARKLVRS
jgi:hypothetical protein